MNGTGQKYLRVGPHRACVYVRVCMCAGCVMWYDMRWGGVGWGGGCLSLFLSWSLIICTLLEHEWSEELGGPIGIGLLKKRTTMIGLVNVAFSSDNLKKIDFLKDLRHIYHRKHWNIIRKG